MTQSTTSCREVVQCALAITLCLLITTECSAGAIAVCRYPPGAPLVVQSACLQATIAYVDLGRPRPERRAALLERYHFDINGQARLTCSRISVKQECSSKRRQKGLPAANSYRLSDQPNQARQTSCLGGVHTAAEVWVSKQ